MAWGKAGSTTLSSAGDTLEISDLSANNFHIILTNTIASGALSTQATFDNDSGTKYAYRNSWDGSGDGTGVSKGNVQQWDGNNGSSTPQFVVSYLCNIDGEEVLGMYWGVDQNTAGAGTAPHRRETVYKFTDTTQITRIDLNNSGAGSFDTDSNLSVLGSNITPASAVTFPTNVQEGSRAEITDTRKMYSFNTQSNVTESTDGSYTVLKFTGDATFTPTSSFNVEYLVVAGGGGSGAGYTTWSGRGGGGGGAGGYLSGTGHGVTPQSYSITVGAGGTANNNGSNSVFSSFTSIGGGRGGQIAGNTSAVGGSGGGGSGGDNGSAGTSGQGNAGANGSGNGSGGAGGGGSNSAGSAGSVPTAGAGGSGTANDILITGSNVTYASGGAGGNSDSSGAGTAGGDNTGNGASGGSGDSGSAGASGGSGIVIIRFLTSGNDYLTTAEIFMPMLQSSGGWKELGRTSGSRASGATLDVSSLPDKRYYMVLYETQGSSTHTCDYRLNGDSGNNYAYRASQNGTSETSSTSTNFMFGDYGGIALDKFAVAYFANLDTKEKLGISHEVRQQTAGAGTAPSRGEYVHKHAQTSNPINQISLLNRGPNTSASGEIVVLGWDPDDTHTTNFWEELASVNATSGDNLSSGTFTAKKYLWVQAWVKYTGAGGTLEETFNNDTGSNYSSRDSYNGGTDGLSTSASNIDWDRGVTDNYYFVNQFIINNSANEKLCIGHQNRIDVTGAGNAPIRSERVDKWANTSAQITEIDFDNSLGGIDISNAYLKVWGSN